MEVRNPKVSPSNPGMSPCHVGVSVLPQGVPIVYIGRTHQHPCRFALPSYLEQSSDGRGALLSRMDVTRFLMLLGEQSLGTRQLGKVAIRSLHGVSLSRG